MEDDAKKYQSIIDQKCPTCYKKGWCMCLPSQRALYCLGPFKDEEDNERKHREDRESESEPKADIEGIVRRNKMEDYRLKRMLFEHGSERSNQNPDETKE